MIRKVIFFHFCKEIMRRSNNTNEQKTQVYSERVELWGKLSR